MGRRTHQKPGFRLLVVADKTKIIVLLRSYGLEAYMFKYKHCSKEADASLKRLSNIHQVQTQIQSHLFESAHSSGQS